MLFKKQKKIKFYRLAELDESQALGEELLPRKFLLILGTMEGKEKKTKKEKERRKRNLVILFVLLLNFRRSWEETETEAGLELFQIMKKKMIQVNSYLMWNRLKGEKEEEEEEEK